jgi:hypothetical protein
LHSFDTAFIFKFFSKNRPLSPPAFSFSCPALKINPKILFKNNNAQNNERNSKKKRKKRHSGNDNDDKDDDERKYYQLAPEEKEELKARQLTYERNAAVALTEQVNGLEALLEKWEGQSRSEVLNNRIKKLREKLELLYEELIN